MKKTQAVSVGIAFVLAITVISHAQNKAITVQSAQEDSIVSAAAEEQGLQLMSLDQVPPYGTFWMVLPGSGGGVILPFPCPPLDQSLPIYAIADGQFLVDGTIGSQATFNTPQAGRLVASSTSAAALGAQADAVLNLITQVQTAAANQQTRTMARAMGMDVPSPGGDSSDYSSSYVAYMFDTNQLWLEITNVSGGVAYLSLHNSTNEVYAIWGTKNLLTPFSGWQVATEVWPGTNQAVTSFTIPMLGDSLFLRAQDWTGVLGDGGIPMWWYWLYFSRTDLLATNLDTVGNTLLYDYLNGLGPNSVLAIHAYWRFDNTNSWVGDAGQLPLLATNLVGVPSWDTNAVLIDSTNPAVLCYRDVEPNGHANINLRNGTVRFWFKPDWSSLYSGGVGLQTMSRLVEVGNYSPDFTNGWWALYLNPDGTQLTFGSSTNGAGNTNLVGWVSWTYKSWHQMALTYSPTNAVLYCDGWEIAENTGTNYYPNSTEQSSGLRIGSDANGGYQAGGVFEDLETFNYQLGASDIENDYYDVVASMPQAPTVTITNPAWGSTCLVGTNHSLNIAVSAGAASGHSVQEVDYSYFDYQTWQYVPLGVSTQPPFSLLWVNPDWTNALAQTYYYISAVAIDDLGTASDYPGGTYVTVELDSDSDGIPDWWMMEHFGHPTGESSDHSLAGDDADGDGISNLQEYLNGTDPTDYYNGNTPRLQVVSLDNPVGSNQLGFAGSFLPIPLTTLVTDWSSNPLTNAPVALAVAFGNVQFAASTNDIPATNLTVRTDSNGLASAWIYFPTNAYLTNNSILAQAGSAQTNVFVALDSDGDGIPDWWMVKYFGHPTGQAGDQSLAGDDADGDGISNLQEYLNGTDPTDSYNGIVPNLQIVNLDNPVGPSQIGLAGSFLPIPLTALVTDGNNTPLFNAQVLLTVISGNVQFAVATNNIPATNLNVRTDSNGLASVWIYFPTNAYLANNSILVQAGPTQTPVFVALDSDSDGIPDWWIWKFYGNLSENATNLDTTGIYTLLYDYQNGINPNVISFRLLCTNEYATSSGASAQVNVSQGMPSYIAVLLDSTNFTGASWNPYTSSNITINLGTTPGWHDVWVGLRGLPPDATQTWQWKHLYLASPPLLVITNPAANVLSQPIIQIYGYCQESLASISYDISNATGIATNQLAGITDRYYDTNACGFTTSYFECLDVPLTNGLNVITLHVTDLAGNTTVTNFNFTLDYSSKTNPPVVQITWPQAGTQISGNNFTCRGWVDDPTAMITTQLILTNGSGTNMLVYTNTYSGSIDRSGNFWLDNLPLQSGTDAFAITIKDVVGNTTVTNISVVQSPLVLTINPVTPDSQLWQATVNLTGTISSTNFAVWVNGVKGTNNGNGTWSANNVPVNDGGTATFTATAYAPDEQQPDGSYGN